MRGQKRLLYSICFESLVLLKEIPPFSFLSFFLLHQALPLKETNELFCQEKRKGLLNAEILISFLSSNGDIKEEKEGGNPSTLLVIDMYGPMNGIQFNLLAIRMCELIDLIP